MLEVLTSNVEKTQAICAAFGLIVGILTVFLLFVNAFFMAFQSWIFRLTLKDGKIRGQIELRAYVSVTLKGGNPIGIAGLNGLIDGVPLGTSIAQGEKELATLSNPPVNWVYNLEAHNLGKTPAKKMVFWVSRNFVIQPILNPDERQLRVPPIEEIREAHKLLSLPTGTGILGPNTPTPFIAANLSSIADIESLKSPEFGVYIFGSVHYEDVFGNPQNTAFRFVHSINAEMGKFLSVLLAHPNGNEAT